jgi:SNF2 family DNA or RNA helicase
MEQLIVVFTSKRNIGLTVIPYFASFNENQPITLHEHATPDHIKANPERFSEQQKEMILLLTKISEHNLHRRYAKKDSIKVFMDQLQVHTLFEKEILPYIDRTIYSAVCLLGRSGLKAYFKDGTFSNVYQSDRLVIRKTPAQPVFNFTLTSEGLDYSLKVRQALDEDKPDKEFSLLSREVEFISRETAVLKIHNNIYYFEDIDSNKFKPFLTKSTIHVPMRQVDIYMEGFVSKCIRNFDVTGKGFEVIEKKEQPLPHLALVKDLQHLPVLGLHFKYGHRVFLADRLAPVYVDYVKSDNGYAFHKIVRDFDFETSIVKRLHQLGLIKTGDALFRPGTCSPKMGPTEMLALVADWINLNKEQLNKEGFSIETSFDNRNIFVGQSKLMVDSTEENDWFEIKVRVQIGEFSLPFFKFRKNLVDENPEFELPNGQIFMIPPEWFTRFSELFDYAKVDKNIIRLPRSHFQIMERVKYGVSQIAKEPGAPKIVFPEVEIPKGIMAKLRPYQTEGYAWLNFLMENGYGGILADDMGLGKTLQTITLLQKIYYNIERAPIDHQEALMAPDAEKVISPKQLSIFDAPPTKAFNKTGIAASLIVMPTSLVHNWQNELMKFSPAMRIYNYTGSNRLRSKDIGKIFQHYHIVLTSYGVLRNDIELIANYPFHYFILDESQYVKNPTSKVYEAVKQIQSKHRLTLTGTPIENSLVDLWAQMNLVNKGLLGSLAFFKRHFVQPITRHNAEDKELKLQKLIQPFLLRRTKEKVAKDLPPIMEQVLYCDMTPEQEKFYEREKSGIRNSIFQVFEHKTPEQSAIMALQGLTRLRQIANHPVMVDENYEGSSGKFEQIVDKLESIVAEGHNVLVFSSFVKDLELLQKELEFKKLSFTKLIGSTRERDKVIKEFNDKASIFLISLKAGGVGLNLTKADYVFMLNPWWNPAAESQAINRAHRIGQTKNVFVYRFLSSGTIEDKIARLQQKKSQLANVFVNNNNPLTDLSRDEILELFS